MNDEIKLVPYNDDDYEFVYEVKKNAYKKYVIECWGSWIEEDQRKYFENFITKVKDNAFIIMDKDKKIGFYNGEVLSNGNYEIGNICIIPEYQGKGIGSKILKEKLEENKDRDIEIQYFKQNPVGKLYKNLGFVLCGETEFHYQMIKHKNDILIRKATIEDIPEISKLHVNSWNKTYKDIIDVTYLNNMKNNIDKRIERMKNEFNLRNMIVATINNEIVAFAEFILTNEFSKDLDIDCELCGLYVKNEYVGTGIGSKVFDYVKSEFIRNKKKKMGLWCFKENKSAVSFYLRKGGVNVKEKSLTLAGKEYTEIAFVYYL